MDWIFQGQATGTMLLEWQLRRFSVGQRIAAAIALLLLPLAALSMASLVVLNDQEATFRETVEESIHTLLPLSTLEHYLQRALVDELKAQSNESVPNFTELTENIDKSFSSIDGSAHDTDLQADLVGDARKAWVHARPSVQSLIEQVHSMHQDRDEASRQEAQASLQLAISDIGMARQQLAQAVEARYTDAVAARRSQLMWLIWSWIVTLAVAALLIIALLHSLLGPVRALIRVTRHLEQGVTDARAPVTGNDEFTALAEHFNQMAAHWEATRESLRSEAAQDPLTGGIDRRGIMTALGKALAADGRTGQPTSILLMDLDHFKRINDRFGHAAGDRALLWVTAQMRAVLREGDFLGRYGGDEFLAVLPATDRLQADQVAQRMARVIGEGAAAAADYPSLSIGVACAPAEGSHPEDLIKAADQALYEVKRQRPAAAVAPQDAGERPAVS